MRHLDIAIEDDRWLDVGFEPLCLRALNASLGHLLITPDSAEISVLACDDARITVLNADFRDKPTATNVLSWPSEERAAQHDGGQPLTPLPGPDGLVELGDIAISYDTCAAEALAAERSIADHVTHLIIHGTLHLLGYDHITDADAEVMEGLEVKILGNLSIDDPYKIIQADYSAVSQDRTK